MFWVTSFKGDFLSSLCLSPSSRWQFSHVLAHFAIHVENEGRLVVNSQIRGKNIHVLLKLCINFAPKAGV